MGDMKPKRAVPVADDTVLQALIPVSPDSAAPAVPDGHCADEISGVLPPHMAPADLVA
jgi:hypothetical protein